MGRILLILLALAGLVTAFQNCGVGGSLSLESNVINRVNANGLDKLLGSCSAPQMCEERFASSLADQAAWQAACAGGTYQIAQCPSTPDRLGICQALAGTQLRRLHYYAGYSQGVIPAAQEASAAQQNCAGSWQ